MTGFATPNHTQTPNSLFDDFLQDMRESELKVVLVIIRKTLGFHKKRDQLSLSQIQNLSGLSRQGVLDGLERAINRGIVKKVDTGKRNAGVYELVFSGDQSTEQTGTGQQNRPELVNEIDTQKKGNKLSKEEHSAPNGAGASQPKPRKREPFYDAIADVWETDASGIIVTIRSIMQGTATRRTIKDCNFNPPVTDVEEIYAFRPFMQARMAEKKMTAPPSAYTTIQAWFYDFRKGRAQRATNGYIPPEQRTSPLDFIRWAEGCEPEWAKDKGAE